MKKLDIWEIADNLEFIANELEILVKKDVKNKILNYSRRLREIHEEKKLKAFDLKNCIKRIEESGNWHLNDSEYGKLKKEWGEHFKAHASDNYDMVTRLREYLKKREG